MAITICSADKIDTTGCRVVARLKVDGRIFKKSFRCASDVSLAIKAAVEYEKNIRAKHGKPVAPKPKKAAPVAKRVGEPRLDTRFGELFAVCPYISSVGRNRISRIPVGSSGAESALKQAESMAMKMSMFGRKLKK